MAALTTITIDTELGTIRLVASDPGLLAVQFEGQRHALEFPELAREDAGGNDVLDAAAAQLVEYLQGGRQRFDVPLAPHGTAFQRRVWDELSRIPFGETTTYGALAARLGEPSAARAVGAAVGRNPIGILIPCHRVLGSDGRLTGYAGGLERKSWLLRLEGVAVGSEQGRLELGL